VASQIDQRLKTPYFKLEVRDKREASTLFIAKEANRIAFDALAEIRRSNCPRWKDRTITIIAIIIAIIAAMADIIWLISCVINFVKTS